MKKLIIIVAFFSYCAYSLPQKAIFLHHSTGRNVYERGNVDKWIKDYNYSNGTSFNLVEKDYPDEPWPWKNYPYDYWKLWVDGSCDPDNPNIECLENLSEKYDLIIFKHCFPGANILENTGNPDPSSDAKTLENYKVQYNELLDVMDNYRETKFLVWTLAPLHRKATTPENAQRANEFVEWVKNDWLNQNEKENNNVYIFDFFSLVAELNPEPEHGFQYCLKYEYEYNHDSDNSHPNTLANEYVGPVFAERIVEVLKDGLSNNDIREINDSSIYISAYNKQITISLPKQNIKVIVYDMMGRSIVKQNFATDLVRFSLDKHGIYLVKLVFQHKTIVKKVIL